MIALACLFVLSGCESDQERMMKRMEKQIQSTIEMDWHRGVPLDDLVNTDKICRTIPNLNGCDTVQSQMLDIAETYASCQKFPNSRLCKAVVKTLFTHPITPLLPQAGAVELPDNPFYWNLPTSLLETQADNFGYRKEVASWWWKSWGTTILSCLALFAAGYASWYGWSKWIQKKQIHARLLAIQRTERDERERILRTQQEQARMQAKHKAKLAHEAAIVEQNRIAAVREAERQREEATAKLAAEQAEAALLLKAAFSQTKRRKHAPSSK